MNEIATQTKGSLAVVPEYLKHAQNMQDAEHEISTEDLLIPRLSVAQDGMSPQLKKQNELFIPGLEPGDLFNTVTSENYGTSVTVIPLFFSKNFIRFAGGGVLKVLEMYATAAEVPSGDLDFGPVDEKTGKKTPPAVTEFKNRMCLIQTKRHSWQPILVSFKKGDIKFSDQWNSQIKMFKIEDRLPCFGHTYTISSKLKQWGEGKSSFMKVVTPHSFTPADVFNSAKEYFDQLSKGGYKVDTTGIEADADATTNSGDASFDADKF